MKGWKGKIMTRKGRLALINSVVTGNSNIFSNSFQTREMDDQKVQHADSQFFVGAG
jgi:hypothetical protein